MRLHPFFCIACCAPALLAAAESPSIESIISKALQPGGTVERKAGKVDARAELRKRGTEALRYLVERVDWECVSFSVLAQELVDQLPAEEALPALAPLLDHASTNVVRSAIYYLSFYTAPELAPRIHPLLRDNRLRGVGLRALGKCLVTNAIPEMAAGLSDTNERIRVSAANALRDVKDPRALEALAPALGDPMFTVRNTALRAMVSYGPEAVPALLQALDDARPATRRQALRGLRELKPPELQASLDRAKRDPDPGVRRDAENGLHSCPATASAP